MTALWEGLAGAIVVVAALALGASFPVLLAAVAWLAVALATRRLLTARRPHTVPVPVRVRRNPYR